MKKKNTTKAVAPKSKPDRTKFSAAALAEAYEHERRICEALDPNMRVQPMILEPLQNSEEPYRYLTQGEITIAKRYLAREEKRKQYLDRKALHDANTKLHQDAAIRASAHDAIRSGVLSVAGAKRRDS